MRRIIACIFSVSMLALSSVSWAEASKDVISELMKTSGFSKQIEQLPESFRAGMQQAHTENQMLSEHASRSMLNAIDDTIKADEIRKSIHKKLSSALTEAEAKDLLTWYQSDLGKKITKVEEQSSTEQAYLAMFNEAERLLQKSELVEFSERLDALVGATDFAMELQEYTSIAILSGFMAANNPEVEINLGELRMQMSDQLRATRPIVEQTILLTFAYTYRDISFVDRASYENFLNKDLSKKFNRVAMENLMLSLEEGITDWIQMIMPLLREEDPALET